MSVSATGSDPSTVPAMFAARLHGDPDAAFVMTPDGGERTYRELGRTASALAAHLADAGVRRGDAVLLHLWNDPAWVVATLACWQMGAVAVACGGQSSATEAGRRAEPLDVRVAVVAEDVEPIEGMVSIVVGTEGVPLRAGRTAPTVVPGLGVAPDDLAAVFFTSGTTGEPKPVRITHEALVSSARTTAAAYSRSSSFRPRTASTATAPAVSFNPFGHLATLGRVVFRLHVGRPVILVRKFDAEVMRALAGRHRFDTLQLTPAMIHTLAFCDLEIDLGSLRYVTAGTAPLPITTRDAFEARYGAPVLVAYGSTEGSVTALERYDDVVAGRRGPGSVGRVAEGTRYRIVEPGGTDVQPGESGELLGRPRAGSDVAVDAQGWHHTGDLARIDEHGILYIVGRLGDTMIVGGFNVEPAQIEDVLRTHPAVSDAVVVALTDERLGEIPAAGVVFAGDPVEPADLASFCRGLLEAYKVPREWQTLDGLPMNDNGKLDRRAAAAALRSGPSDAAREEMST